MEESMSRVRPHGWKAWVCGLAIAGTAMGAVPAGAASAPGAPTVTGVTPGLGSVNVSYSPPASDGGSHITEYKVACFSSDGGVSKSETEH